MKHLPLAALQRVLLTKNSNPVTVGGTTYPPGSLFFQSFEVSRALHNGELVFDVCGRCRRMSGVVMPEAFEESYWPDWIDLTWA